MITGHSLGGALAQLMATELVGSVDVSRGFKAKDDGSLFGMAKRAFAQTKQSFPGMELPKWASVSLYTYGAPRVGNSQFAAYFETLFAGTTLLSNQQSVVSSRLSVVSQHCRDVPTFSNLLQIARPTASSTTATSSRDYQGAAPSRAQSQRQP